jgi:hypothetical protein
MSGKLRRIGASGWASSRSLIRMSKTRRWVFEQSKVVDEQFGAERLAGDRAVACGEQVGAQPVDEHLCGLVRPV